MNVHCQSCETVYRVDPLKVPAEGVRARCTICSTVIEVTRSTEEEAPATARPMTPHAPSQADRVAHQLGDAFIPAPDDEEEERASEAVLAETDDGGGVVSASPVDIQPAPSLGEASDHTSVESIPGIIMPPEEDDAVDAPMISSQPFVAPEVREPSASLPVEELAPPPEPSVEPEPRPRVSRPFSLPQDIAKPAPVDGQGAVPPTRPTAPVFRPTPGRPVRAPTTAPPPRPSPSPPVTAPAPAVSSPSPVIESPNPIAPPAKPVNPFLSRDPGQKARRLARALISDMIVYQPDKRQRALQEGNLKEAFEEEIKKSWEEYVEQVGDDLANSTSYFTDALNDLLADGDKVF